MAVLKNPAPSGSNEFAVPARWDHGLNYQTFRRILPINANANRMFLNADMHPISGPRSEMFRLSDTWSVQQLDNRLYPAISIDSNDEYVAVLGLSGIPEWTMLAVIDTDVPSNYYISGATSNDYIQLRRSTLFPGDIAFLYTGASVDKTDEWQDWSSDRLFIAALSIREVDGNAEIAICMNMQQYEGGTANLPTNDKYYFRAFQDAKILEILEWDRYIPAAELAIAVRSAYDHYAGRIPLSSSGGQIDGDVSMTPLSKLSLGVDSPIDTIESSGYIVAGEGSGSVAMTTNDAYGNANLTFNHRRGNPDADGSSGRITVNSDNSAAIMQFQLKSATYKDVPVALNQTLILSENYLYPGADAALNLGVSNRRIANIYLVNSPVVTSDERSKVGARPISPAELKVAEIIIGRVFQHLHAHEQEGEQARLHFGVLAQEIVQAFEFQGLDPYSYAINTKDEWWEWAEVIAEAVDPQPEVVDDDGKVIQEARPGQSQRVQIHSSETQEDAPEGAEKKDRLGVRYVELYTLLFSAIKYYLEEHRKEIDLLKAQNEEIIERLVALETRPIQ